MTHGSNQATPVSRALLPSAAQCWLDRVLPHDLDLPTSIQIEQEGSIEIGGVRIPAAAVATFEKDDGPWTCFRGRITSLKLEHT